MFGFLFGRDYRVTEPGTPRKTPETLTLSTDLRALEARLSSLELACGGMWRLLKAKTGSSDEELMDEIHAMDSHDGRVAGNRPSVGYVCPHCGRRLLSRSTAVCSWCGGALPTSPL